LLRAQLERLGVKRLLLAIHDTSFPSDPDEDIGRGSPATRAAQRLFAYAKELGFTGIQLGPQGQTSRANPSPYDGTIFSRHLGNISVHSLGVPPDMIQRWLVPGGPAQHAHAYDAMHTLVAEAYALITSDQRERLAEFRRANARWLESDALHAALFVAHGDTGFRDWPERDRDPRTATRAGFEHAIDRYAFGQMLVHEEHARVRARCGLLLYGDLQVGYSDADAWAHHHEFLPGYRMGAPPSRTNPDGQPWGYPVLDPNNPAGRALMVARADKAFAEYDSLRIDHPHGLVCPWVYPDDDFRAGTRLHESPDRLPQYAYVREDQLDRSQPRHGDRWVRALEPPQIDRYATYVDALVEAARAHGREVSDLSAEVLSTMPAPLAAVLRRHKLGRWRVTQKANLDDPTDVYRTENVAREDWVMLGNHDTAPIFAVLASWSPAKREQWARHLVQRLRLVDPSRLSFDGFFATAMLAELFLSAAENVSIFFADLFGYDERFNVPGLVDEANWTLRLPADFEALHARRLAANHALDLPLAVQLALAAA
jgi:4-alpha-glucanotransferase